jgi:YidC/Oxa1 family membrane protein insertase
MKKNELIAIILSAVVIMIYFGVIYPRFAPAPPPPSNKPVATDTTPIPVSVATTETAPPKSPEPVQPVAIDSALFAQAKSIVIDTDLYQATFSTLGGKLTSWRLKKYPIVFESAEYLQKELAAAQAKNNVVRVIQIQLQLNVINQIDKLTTQLHEAELNKDTSRTAELNQQLAIVSYTDLINPNYPGNEPLSLKLAGLGAIDNTTLYQVTTSTLSLNSTKPETQLVFSTALPNGTTLQKIYQFNNRTYLMNGQIILTNTTDKLIRMNQNGEAIEIGLGTGLSNIPIDSRQAMSFGLAPMAQWKNGVSPFKLNQKNPRQTMTGDLVWAGMQTNYYFKALIPQNNSATTITASIGEHQLPDIRVQISGFDLAGKDTYNYPFSFYLGPKELKHLELAKLPAEQILFPGFYLASLDFWVLKILIFCYWLIPNYGVAIILLSIFFKLITLPLTQMSFKSMKKMQLLAPQMNEIKAKYKEDPRKMHQETMALMKKYRVSYGSGCLPMIIQMPIMFALYSTISRAVELSGQPFIFWIKDLSKPDTIGYIAGYPFNILPILMGITMIWQMQMTPNPDPQQKKTMMFMNVIFIFLFWSLSSGLVLYWFITNILSVIHQYYINKLPIKLEAVPQHQSKYSRWQEMKKKYQKR